MSKQRYDFEVELERVGRIWDVDGEEDSGQTRTQSTGGPAGGGEQTNNLEEKMDETGKIVIAVNGAKCREAVR